MTDLIIASVKGYGWPQLQAYAVSLCRTGFTGVKLMFVDGITREARENLAALGFQLEDFSASDTGERYVVHGRFAPVVSFLEKHKQDFRFAIWTDTKDVVFQSDPAAWLAAHIAPSRILGAGECWRIKDETVCNARWVQAGFDASTAAWLPEQEACCGGTLAGYTEEVSVALSSVYQMVSESRVMNDQAALNYVLRVPPLAGCARVPRLAEGFAVMLAAFRSKDFYSCVPFDQNLLLDGPPLFDKATGTVYASAGVPFSIVHQYERDADWKASVEAKYRAL